MEEVITQAWCGHVKERGGIRRARHQFGMLEGDLWRQTGSKQVAIVTGETSEGPISSHCGNVAEKSAKTEAIKGDVVVANS